MSESGQHIINKFDLALEELRNTLLEMGRLSRKGAGDAVRALMERKVELCNEVIADDETVDQLEVKIDGLGMEILLKFRPVATDLRLVLAAMDISRNLERIADHAVNIAKRSRKILRGDESTDVNLIEPLYTLAEALIADSLKSFAEGNVELAMGVGANYDKLKKLTKKTIKALTLRLETEEARCNYYLHLIFICRSLDRIGALSVNIAEGAVFHESAEVIRHGRDES